MLIVIPGIATPQGSARAFVVKGRAVVTSDNPRLKSWRDAVRSAAFDTIGGRILYPKGPVKVSAEFVMSMPVGKRFKRKAWPVLHATKPDLDKLTRALLDGLTGTAFTDDGQVSAIDVTKRYMLDEREAPHTRVEVERIGVEGSDY